MLNQNHPLPDRGVNPIQANEGAHDAHVFAAQQHGKRHTAAQNQNKHESIFTIAKGGWQEEAASRRGPQREKEGKAPHAVGYHFDFDRHDRRHAPGVEVAATRDCDARLELHYATETSVRNFATKPATTQVRNYTCMCMLASTVTRRATPVPLLPPPPCISVQ